MSMCLTFPQISVDDSAGKARDIRRGIWLLHLPALEDYIALEIERE